MEFDEIQSRNVLQLALVSIFAKHEYGRGKHRGMEIALGRQQMVNGTVQHFHMFDSRRQKHTAHVG